MQNILKAHELKTELETLRPLDVVQEARIMQKFRLDWNYHSNHLEGNSLTFGETKNLILHGITAQGKPLKDHFEITGHNEALNWIIDVVKEERPLTENFIRELHTLLLKESYEVDAITPEGQPTKKRVEVGKYKTSPNHVKTSTGEIFRFAEPEETAAKMHDLLEWYRSKKDEKDINPVLLAAEFHYKFVAIHPFDDGNGRMARILMNFILMSFGYPPVIIKTDDKVNYFSALRQADIGDIEAFVDYIAKNLIRSLEIMIAGAKGESIEEPDDIDKNIALLEHRLKGIGKKIEVIKSKKTLVDLITKSYENFIIEFVNKCDKMAKFYLSHYLEVFFVGKKEFKRNSIAEIFKIISDNATNDTNSILICYSFRHFNNSNIEAFDFSSVLEFSFEERFYEIITDTQKFKKLYHEKLDEKEIDSLIKDEMEFHNKFIEEKIKEFEEKNSDK